MFYDVNRDYLVDMPKEFQNYGISKVLLVRREVIHIKHIMTEIFVRQNIDIEPFLNKIGMTLFQYMGLLTNRIRNIHNFPRSFTRDCNAVVNMPYQRFFPLLGLYNGLNNVIVLDFDGVITHNKFHNLYKTCCERGNVIVCSGNPTVNEEYFIKRDLPLPKKIYANKGKVQKIKRLVDLQSKYDMMLYVDNETEYLDYAWLFGIKTFHWNKKNIKYYTKKIK